MEDIFTEDQFKNERNALIFYSKLVLTPAKPLESPSASVIILPLSIWRPSPENEVAFPFLDT